MMSQNDIDAMIGSFIEGEQNTPPNPFLSERVMALIERTGEDKIRVVPIWQGVAVACSLVAAIALGIKAGSLYRPAGIGNDQTSVMLINDGKTEHFMFYRQIPNE